MEIDRTLTASPAEPEDEGARLNLRALWRTPMPQARTRRQMVFWNRLVLSVFRKRVLEIKGAHQIILMKRPYLLVANHSTRYEALVLPGIVNYLREGSPVHFFADWNFALYPLVGHIMRKGEAIMVTRKPARPAFLNHFRPLFRDKISTLERAAEYLRCGEPVGIFPEGTRNPRRDELLRGDRGAAWLSLSENIPVLPVGIRHPGLDQGNLIPESSPMTIEFGSPIYPKAHLSDQVGGLDAVREWHGRIMMELSRLSGKKWNPSAKRKKYELD